MSVQYSTVQYSTVLQYITVQYLQTCQYRHVRHFSGGETVFRLSTVLRAVSGNSREGASFKLDKQTWRRKSNGTQKTISQNLFIKIL